MRGSTVPMGPDAVAFLQRVSFHVKIRFRPAIHDSARLTFKNNCVKSNKHIYTGWAKKK